VYYHYEILISGGEKMKKLLLLIFVTNCYVCAFPNFGLAEEKCLYNICKEAIELFDLAGLYINGHVKYTEDDLVILKNSAYYTLKDVYELVNSQDKNLLNITPEQARELSVKTRRLTSNIIKAQNICDIAIIGIYFGIDLIYYGLLLTFLIVGAFLGIPMIIVGTIIGLIGLIAAIPCLLLL
jgi:hypothetical protein